MCKERYPKEYDVYVDPALFSQPIINTIIIHHTPTMCLHHQPSPLSTDTKMIAEASLTLYLSLSHATNGQTINYLVNFVPNLVVM